VLWRCGIIVAFHVKKGNPPPSGVKLDIAEKNVRVSVTECFKTPLNDDKVYAVAERGRISGTAFFCKCRKSLALNVVL